MILGKVTVCYCTYVLNTSEREGEHPHLHSCMVCG